MKKTRNYLAGQLQAVMEERKKTVLLMGDKEKILRAKAIVSGELEFVEWAIEWLSK